MDVWACLADKRRYERQIERLHERYLLTSRLYELSQVLDVPVSFFYDGMAAPANPAAGRRRGLAEEAPAFERDPMTKRETLDEGNY